MKHTDGFDARRLRPRGPRSWRLRIVFAVGVLLAIAGTLLALFAAASLLGSPQLAELMVERDAGVALLAVGIGLLLIGLLLGRSAWRRLRASGDLSMSRHLMRRR
ncbi:hypothetical protein [Stutzerimonas nitrititolerans]|uniref:hypothetical protein n=1 Tax=Stutzerimonas nitrititolerans TaxID=2482751 RepID=UPI0028AD5D76|nr:hypothetical protein [Stutzerimonas nitrititolerans]